MNLRPLSFLLFLGLFAGCTTPEATPQVSPKAIEFNFVYSAVKSAPSLAQLGDIKIETEIESCLRVNSLGNVDSIEYVRGINESKERISAFLSRFTFTPAALDGGAQPSRLIIKIRPEITGSGFEYKIIHIGAGAPALSWVKLP